MALNRVSRVLMHNATYAATHASLQIPERSANTARFYLNVTTASGTGGITWVLRGYDKASGLPFTVVQDPNPITAIGMYIFEVAPGAATASGALRVSFQANMPINYDVQMVHGDSSNYAYSLSVENGS